MPANHRSPKRRTSPGSGRTTPKGTRPPGTPPPSTSDGATSGIDHHLPLTSPQHLHGRSAPPNVIRRPGHRGGR